MSQSELGLWLDSSSDCDEQAREPPSHSAVQYAPQPQQRTLKIEVTGDYWLRRVKPKIRLCGKWLEQAGFKPGHRVQVIFRRTGELTLQFQEDPESEPQDDA